MNLLYISWWFTMLPIVVWQLLRYLRIVDMVYSQVKLYIVLLYDAVVFLWPSLKMCLVLCV